MTDREMLELAAKAAGIELLFPPHSHPGYWTKWRGHPEWSEWHPLSDDGDAFRLAVRLRLDIGMSPEPDNAVGVKPAAQDWWEIGVRSDDLYAATRRAIVRAAAAIGSKL